MGNMMYKSTMVLRTLRNWSMSEADLVPPPVPLFRIPKNSGDKFQFTSCYPKCTPSERGVKHIARDMFESVPKGEVILMKVVLGGGQDASSVTTTDHRVGNFESKFYDKILEEEIGAVKGHFGPINALSFNPDGKRFSFTISAIQVDKPYFSNLVGYMVLRNFEGLCTWKGC